MKKQTFFILFTLVGTLWAQETSIVDDLTNTINTVFEGIAHIFASVLFFPIFNIPFVLFVLICGGVLFTLYYRLRHFRLFFHGFKVILGKFDNPQEVGQITHFQALTSALSATVGLGNIAGVAIAIGIGGPGIVFWMWVTALLGMALKFTSCTLANLFRKVDQDGSVLGGPMVYIKEAFARKNLLIVGQILAVIYCFFTIVGGIGAGNLFQMNQIQELWENKFPLLDNHPYIIGVITAILVGVVILGGIKRIGKITSWLVPSMCFSYVLVCLCIIFSHYAIVPQIFASMITQAFVPDAIFGGLFVVILNGMKRASFSNESGLGSAAIAHASAKTQEPVREGSVAMLGPFIDTIVVCTITALALLSSGVHLDPNLKGKGAAMTAAAFKSLHPSFVYFLIVIASIFAYSTLISWSHYIEKAMHYLFGKKSILGLRIVYTFIVMIGPFVALDQLLEVADLFLLSMSFPNILACTLFLPLVNTKLKDYLSRMKKLKSL